MRKQNANSARALVTEGCIHKSSIGMQKLPFKVMCNWNQNWQEIRTVNLKGTTKQFVEITGLFSSHSNLNIVWDLKNHITKEIDSISYW